MTKTDLHKVPAIPLCMGSKTCWRNSIILYGTFLLNVYISPSFQMKYWVVYT